MRKQQQYPPRPSSDYGDPEGTKRAWALVARYERSDYTSSSGGQFRHLNFHLVSVPGYFGAGSPDPSNMRNELDAATYDLELTSQGDQFDPDQLYCYEPVYTRVHHVDRRKAERMASFLGWLDR